MSRASPVANRAAAGLGALALVLAAGAAATPQGEPLEPEKAFPAEIALVTTAGEPRPRAGLEIRFRILDGYYLYRDRFRLAAEGAALPLGPPVLPAGIAKDDPFIGKTEILRKLAIVKVPFEGRAQPGTYRLRVTAQGCAEELVCYAPFTQVLEVRVPPGHAATDDGIALPLKRP